MVHKHNGMLLSYKKKYMRVSSNEVSDPRAYYIEWGKSGRERQILYVNTHAWNLERLPWWLRQ